MRAHNALVLWEGRVGKLLLLLLVWSLAVLALTGSACSDRPQDLWVYVEAEVVEPLAPVEVEAGGVAMSETRLMFHEVTISWREDFPAILDDMKFGYRIETRDTELIVAGPATFYDPDTDGFISLGIWAGARLEERGSYSYGIRLQSPRGRVMLRRGEYVVDQRVAWWRAAPGEDGPQPREHDGTFTIRLTYTVE